MKKAILLTGAAMVLATAVLAGPPKKDAKKDTKAAVVRTEVQCSVMPARKVNVKTATASKMYSDYKGNRYFFCCGACPAQFKADPAKYAKADHIAIPKVTAPKTAPKKS